VLSLQPEPVLVSPIGVTVISMLVVAVSVIVAAAEQLLDCFWAPGPRVLGNLLCTLHQNDHSGHRNWPRSHEEGNAISGCDIYRMLLALMLEMVGCRLLSST
jgi:hypothetical protein